MKLFKEWCIRKNSRRGTMVELSRLERVTKSVSNPGYAGVYSFDETAASEIIESKCSRGFDRFTPYSDRLVIDLDDGAASLGVVEPVLQQSGWRHEIWESGGKGYHIYLFHTLVGSKDLPYSHLCWVKEHLPNVAVDESLYQHGRILSLPGRVHERTGKRKRLVRQAPGDDINLTLIPKPGIQFDFSEDAGLGNLEGVLLALLGVIAAEPTPGNRHNRIWQISKDLARAGLRPETALDLMLKVNGTWKNQKELSEVERAVKEAYYQSSAI